MCRTLSFVSFHPRWIWSHWHSQLRPCFNRSVWWVCDVSVLWMNQTDSFIDSVHLKSFIFITSVRLIKSWWILRPLGVRWKYIIDGMSVSFKPLCTHTHTQSQRKLENQKETFAERLQIVTQAQDRNGVFRRQSTCCTTKVATLLWQYLKIFNTRFVGLGLVEASS